MTVYSAVCSVGVRVNSGNRSGVRVDVGTGADVVLATGGDGDGVLAIMTAGFGAILAQAARIARNVINGNRFRNFRIDNLRNLFDRCIFT